MKNETINKISSSAAEVEHQNELMATVNNISSILSEPSLEEFDNNLIRSIHLLAEVMDVQCVYVWNNHIIDGKLYCSQMFEWSEKKTMFADGSLYNYNEIVPGWEETLSSGKYINSLVRNMSPKEQDHLSPSGIISILVAPIFLQGGFWGFIGIDDCQKERVFTKNEETILNLTGRLIANALIRNEMTQKIQNTAAEVAAFTDTLENILNNHDADYDVCWDTLEFWADSLFPRGIGEADG